MKRFAAPQLRSLGFSVLCATLTFACGDSGGTTMGETGTSSTPSGMQTTPDNTSNPAGTNTPSGAPNTSTPGTTSNTPGGSTSSTTGDTTTTTTTTGGDTTTSMTTTTSGDTSGTDTGKMLSFATDVLPVFEASCGCHRPTDATKTPADGLDLRDSAAFTAIVNVDSKDVPAMKLVKPEDPTNSYLYRKMDHTHTAAGGQGGGMPNPKVGADKLKLVSDWIAQGAKM